MIGLKQCLKIVIVSKFAWLKYLCDLYFAAARMTAVFLTLAIGLPISLIWVVQVVLVLQALMRIKY